MDFKREIAKVLEKPTKLTQEEILGLLEVPPNTELGDYAFPCFNLSKSLKKSPIELAKSLQTIKYPITIKKIQAVGPYLNFFINKSTLAEETITKIIKEKENYGAHKTNQTILIEGWQPNTHKAFHIGHIRNAVLSEAISRILEFNGYKVIRTAYMGDIGAHVAKWIWYFKKFYKGSIPKEKVSKWAGILYTKATVESEKNKSFQEEIQEIQRQLEQGDPKLLKLWKETRELCLKDFKRIFKELDCSIHRYYFESEVEKEGIGLVKDLEKKGIARYSEGAIILDLESYNLGVFVLLKSNGTSLYSTKDLALAKLKEKEYHYDSSLYIVANEQDHHFRQLFKTLELSGFKGYKKLKHISYGLVRLQEGKMSSRLGNILLYEDFRDQVMVKAEKQLKQRNLSKDKKEKIKHQVAFGAIKFTMLAQDPQKEIVFNSNQALSFEGFSGPYLQYVCTRAYSILKKAKYKPLAFNATLIVHPTEQALITKLSLFPEITQKAATELKPSLISYYLLDLAKSFNEFYHQCPCIQTEKELAQVRQTLVAVSRQTLKNGLNLLGIESPEEM